MRPSLGSINKQSGEPLGETQNGLGWRTAFGAELVSLTVSISSRIVAPDLRDSQCRVVFAGIVNAKPLCANKGAISRPD